MANPNIQDPEVFMYQCQSCLALHGAAKQHSPKHRAFCAICRLETTHLAIYLDFAAQMFRVQHNRSQDRKTSKPAVFGMPYKAPPEPKGCDCGDTLLPGNTELCDFCAKQESKPMCALCNERRAYYAGAMGPLCIPCWDLEQQNFWGDAFDYWDQPEGFADYD